MEPALPRAPVCGRWLSLAAMQRVLVPFSEPLSPLALPPPPVALFLPVSVSLSLRLPLTEFFLGSPTLLSGDWTPLSPAQGRV